MTEKQKAGIRNTICALCLSLNRKLGFIGKEQLALLNIIQIPVEEKVCWECKSIISKLVSFRERAIKAQKTLADIYKSLEDMDMSFTIECLSSLEVSEVKSCLIHPMKLTSKHQLVISEYDIKREPFDENLGIRTIVHDEITKSIESEMKHSKDPLSNNKETNKETPASEEAKDGQSVKCKGDTYPENDLNTHLKKNESKPSFAKNENQSCFEKPLQEELKQVLDIEKGSFDYENQLDLTASDGGENTSPDTFETDMLAEKCTLRTITREEVLQAREARRNKKKFISQNFKCDLCIESFSTERYLNGHLMKHSESYGSFCCDICELRYNTSNDLDEHKTTHFNRYFCRECEFDTNDPDAMWSHYDYLHEINRRPCETCGVTLMTKYLFRKHKRAGHKGTRPLCDTCGIKCSDYEALKHHVLSHTEVPQLKCPVCAKSFRGSWALRSHLRASHKDMKDGDSVYCAECNVHFRNLKLYRLHISSTLKHVTDESMKHRCPHCEKSFTIPWYLKRHVLTVHAAHGLACPSCDKSYGTKKELRRHILSVHEKPPRERKYVCEFCAKAYYNAQGLRQHVNTHFGRRPYVCDFCGDTFSFSGALHTHKRLKHLQGKKAPAKQKKIELTSSTTETAAEAMAE